MGCAYTGRAGGPMRTDIPTATCPNDAAENAIMITLNSTQRNADRFMFIAFPENRLKAERENGSS
jgi:hypothetical protein